MNVRGDKKEKLVSICVPTYNGATYLHETLACIKAQDYGHIEVIISDDQSKDDTLKIATQYAQESDFPVHIHKHTPAGIGANWNHCISKAHGAYIKFLFQDDLMTADCVRRMVDTFDAHPDTGIVASKRTFLYTTENKELVERMSKYEDLQEGMTEQGGYHVLSNTLFGQANFMSSPYNKVGEPSVTMFRKSLIDTVGLYREDLDQILDYEFCYRVLRNATIRVIKDKLVTFRIHDTQASQVNQNKAIKDYERWERMLYDDYNHLIHPELKEKLYQRYHPWPELKRKIKAKLTRS